MLIRTIGNPLINEDLNYDTNALKREHAKYYEQQNNSQRQAYDAIITSVQNEEGKLIFIHGHCGTGKRFLQSIITSYLRSYTFGCQSRDNNKI